MDFDWWYFDKAGKQTEECHMLCFEGISALPAQDLLIWVNVDAGEVWQGSTPPTEEEWEDEGTGEHEKIKESCCSV